LPFAYYTSLKTKRVSIHAGYAVLMGNGNLP